MKSFTILEYLKISGLREVARIMKNNLEENITEPTKEQVEKWEIESDALLNYFGHDDWGSVFFSKKEAFKIGYLKAKKSDFEEIESLKRVYNLIADSNTEKIFKIEDMESEIKTLKEQLAERLSLVSQEKNWLD